MSNSEYMKQYFQSLKDEKYITLRESGPYGVHRIVLHNSEIKGGWAGKVPIGFVEWYQQMPVSFFDSEYCPMRGSKRGIAARNGSRVHEYEYWVMERLGAKMGTWMKKNDKHVSWIKSKKQTVLQGHSSVGNCAKDSFMLGLISAYNDKNIFYSGAERKFYVGQCGEIVFAIDAREMSSERIRSSLDLISEIGESCYSESERRCVA